jgi:hypothetical protein
VLHYIKKKKEEIPEGTKHNTAPHTHSQKKLKRPTHTHSTLDDIIFCKDPIGHAD